MIKLLLAAVCLQTLLYGAESCGGRNSVGRRASVIETDTYVEVCTQEPIELGIVLDASRSISHANFNKSKSFLEDYLRQFDVGTDREGVRVSIIPYGRGVYPEVGFNLTTYNTKAEVLEAICDISHSLGDTTDTDKGINYMHLVQMADSVVRPWAEKISIVLTDGNSAYPERTRKAAEAARQDGIKIFAVGVGHEIHESELLNIAGDMSRVISVTNYEQLSSIKETLASKICKKKMKPTSPPKIVKCGELNPADVYFAFSPADLGIDGTAWTTSFISKIITDSALNLGFQFGVVSGSCPDDEGFKLGAYSTTEQYQLRLEQYDLPRLPGFIERLSGDAYSVQNGGRVKANKVAVIVAPGDEDIILEDLRAQVLNLIQSGVTVYIADPSGSGFTVDGAVSLTGKGSLTQAETFISYLCPS